MSSSMVKYVSQDTTNNNGHEDGNERLDLIHGSDPMASSTLLLPSETFLKAAVSLKDQV